MSAATAKAWSSARVATACTTSSSLTCRMLICVIHSAGHCVVRLAGEGQPVSDHGRPLEGGQRASKVAPYVAAALISPPSRTTGPTATTSS